MLPISTVSPSTHISHTPETWFLPITILTNELHITKFNRYFSVLGIHYLISQSLQHLDQLYSSSFNFLTLHSPVIFLPAGIFSSTCPLNVGITSISVLDTLIISLLTFFLGNFTHTVIWLCPLIPALAMWMDHRCVHLGMDKSSETQLSNCLVVTNMEKCCSRLHPLQKIIIQRQRMSQPDNPWLLAL